MSKVVIIGAGKTGRGFLARLLREKSSSEPEIVFIDKNGDLVSKLNKACCYSVSFFGDVREPVKIGGYRAYTWEDAGLEAEFAGCDTVLVSVGGQNLPDVARMLSEHTECTPQAIITAENASHPAQTLKNGIARPVSVSEGTVFCTTIEADGLDIRSENYPYFQYNAELVSGYTPPAPALKAEANFADFLTRKLYTYNAASCVIAYLGWKKGYTDYAEAANDPEITEKLDRNYAVTNRVLCAEYGYGEESQCEFAMLSRTKFLNRTITDTISRNARDPARKLAAGERIMGPLRLMYKYGEDAGVLEETAACALMYEAPDDPGWKELLAKKGRAGVLRDICGLRDDEVCFRRILEICEAAENATSI